ncbi:hypothetical protein ACLKA7_012709 [Drosophila subpalustris]
MLRLWIPVLTLALITGSASGGLNYWLPRFGLGQPPSPPKVLGGRLIDKLSDRVSQRVDKMQDRVLQRIDGVAGIVADKVSDRLDNVAASLTNKVADTVSSGIDGLAGGLANGLTGGIASGMSGGLANGLASGVANRLTGGMANGLAGGILPAGLGGLLGGGDNKQSAGQPANYPNRSQVGASNQNSNGAQPVEAPPTESGSLVSGLMSGISGFFG